jgi:hypothetical protein
MDRMDMSMVRWAREDIKEDGRDRRIITKRDLGER